MPLVARSTAVVEQSLRIRDQDYGILSPVDIPAYLCRWPDDAAAEPELVTDPHQYPQVLDELDMIIAGVRIFSWCALPAC